VVHMAAPGARFDRVRGAAEVADLGLGGLVGWWAGGLVGWWAGGLVGWWAGGLVGACGDIVEVFPGCRSYRERPVALHASILA
jgi:hypothetical protein